MKEEKDCKLATFDFFHITALVLSGYEIDSITRVDGLKPKGLVSFESKEQIPALSSFKLTGDKLREIGLDEFGAKFREIKRQILDKIDEEK